MASQKDTELKAAVGKTFETRSGRKWVFDYTKQGRKYIYKIKYKGHVMQIPESDFRKQSIEHLLDLIETGIKIK